MIERFHGVEKIGDEFYSDGNNSFVTPFQSLEILKFSDMKIWKEWSSFGQFGKEGKCFPRLKVLSFDGCPNLAGNLPHCDTIETLTIFESDKPMEHLMASRVCHGWRDAICLGHTHVSVSWYIILPLFYFFSLSWPFRGEELRCLSYVQFNCKPLCWEGN